MYYEGLRKAMKEMGDTQQDLAFLLGLKWGQSVNERINKRRDWRELEIQYCCNRYGKSRKELGF